MRLRSGSRDVSEDTSMVRRLLVATDRSRTASLAVRFAVEMAERYDAELVVLQVIVPPAQASPGAVEDVNGYARELAGDRGRGKLVVDDDPARAIVDAAEEEDVDVVVVGNVGMSGRKEFLLGNVPNRVSHASRRTVVIVNTAQALEEGAGRRRGLFR